MTEVEWISCDNPKPLLLFLSGRTTDRKFRLFACACCHRIWTRISQAGCRDAVAVAELFSEGQCGRAELNAAWREASRLAREAGSEDTGYWPLIATARASM